MAEKKNQKLASSIKADLQDILKNKSRWGKGNYFFDYSVISDKIWVKEWDKKENKINEEVKRLVKENAQLNHSRRKKIHDEKIAKNKKEWENQHKRSFGSFPFKLDEEEIWPEELEKVDYNEIVNLINQIKQAKEAKLQAELQARNKKVASRSDLFYWGGGKRYDGGYFIFPEWSGSHWKKRDGHYCAFLKKQSDKPSECWSLEINPNHPVLDNFPFEKAGFYIIKGIENLSREASPTNGTPSSSRDWFFKFVELGDNIIITPYDENNLSLLLPKKSQLEEQIRSFFLTHNIYQITSIDRRHLLIKYKNGKERTIEAISDQELAIAQLCQKSPHNSIFYNQVKGNNIYSHSSVNSNQNNNKLLIGLVGGGIGVIIVVGLLLVVRRRKK